MTAQSKLTAQGQISIPAEVRRRLGLGPGSVIEWEEHGDGFLVRRSGKFSSLEIHEVLFPAGAPETDSVVDHREGIKTYIRKRHARR